MFQNLFEKRESGADEVKRIDRVQDKFQVQTPGTTVRIPINAPKFTEQVST